MKNYFLIIFVAISISACNKTEPVQETKSEYEHLLMSTVWFQQSAEMKALYHQCYNWATVMLDKYLENIDTTKKACVIVDIDETVLDNSPFEAKCIETGKGYSSETWKEWTDQAKAKALPGALEFLNYAKEKGVETIYISNRKLNELEKTRKNLSDLGFPFIDDAHMLFKDSVNSKKDRRIAIGKEYQILLLIGDQLTDFTEIFEKRDSTLGFDLVEQYKNEFGDRFILLPNPMYGEWEGAIYGNDFKISDALKAEKRRKILKSF
ncbi:MAG TPA: 5'-nucleotidase, lipoprotein e(P4) family [Bacteroidales bacterium]|nr:MAG: 5'-nucleotidase, lipoprotein e(P4) family [Bacteroidetes bacterium GWF2_33_38]OFY70143.1 MAG: 5'-nucleotidase, lipoprotein e(P4) family [Bacteroidetes bacterium RIFOXYA12_FULL_33_9]OFY88747.1 MAG: 5'-nucleotidase, lipoprotein e(P4) family [Bacteroidetes bacterium RIFOXYA2_FULL_33_7]HBF87730.1 5'-nucleotidase, lipoprotein e(P4) family [Bacteroidales bacterium]